MVMANSKINDKFNGNEKNQIQNLMKGETPITHYR
jgi:hypothetical protein